MSNPNVGDTPQVVTFGHIVGQDSSALEAAAENPQGVIFDLSQPPDIEPISQTDRLLQTQKWLAGLGLRLRITVGPVMETVLDERFTRSSGRLTVRRDENL